MEESHGWIFDIKRFAIHDGPGIRTTVFLKGCPLACWWCHNPESISPRPELAFFPRKCIGCQACFEVCPNHAHEALESGDRAYHPERCTLCGKCVERCYAEALQMEGRLASVADVMAEVRQDVPFYETSGGGATLSGGEPLLQADFAAALLRQCKAEGIHTALDTCGHARWEAFEKVLPATDLVLFDLKHTDTARHRELTGVPNDLILANLRKLAAAGVPIEIRMPIIPTLNDGRETIEGATALLRGLDHVTRVTLLPYHRLGESKPAQLRRERRMPRIEAPDKERLREIADCLEAAGLEVHVSG